MDGRRCEPRAVPASLECAVSILLRIRHREEAERQAKVLAMIAREVDPGVPMRVVGTPAGDEQRLRGIPALGRGVGGAIAGTRPGNVR